MKQSLALALFNVCDEAGIPAKMIFNEDTPHVYKIAINATYAQFVNALIRSDEFAFEDEYDNIYGISDIADVDGTEMFLIS